MATPISLLPALTKSRGAARRRLAGRRRQVALMVVVVLLSCRVTNQSSHLRAAEPELPAARFLLTWGKEGTEPGEFHFPIGIAINPADEILVTDHYNNRVQRFDREGKLLGHFAVLPSPGGIALDKGETSISAIFQLRSGATSSTPTASLSTVPPASCFTSGVKRGPPRVNSAIRAG